VQGKAEIKWRDTRKAKEDAQRAAGNAGDALIYQLRRPSRAFACLCFSPGRRRIAEIFHFRRRPELS